MKLNIKKLNNSMREYNKLDKDLQNMFNEKTKDMLYFVFASSEKEFIDKLKDDYGVNVSEIVNIGYGGYIKKENVDKFNELNEYILKTKKQFCNDFYNCCGLFLNYLWDYESRIGFDGYERAYNDLCCYMGVDKIKDDKLIEMLNATIDYYDKEFDRINGY